MTVRYRREDFIKQPRGDRMYEEYVQDLYNARGKWPEPTRCPDCSAVFHNGRWQWGLVLESAYRHRCPACSRIHDRLPACILTLSGDFFAINTGEVMNLVHRVAKEGKAQHPLERIMNIEEWVKSHVAIITYTGLHLTKSTGEALSSAFHGKFAFEYSDRHGTVHASWKH